MFFFCANSDSQPARVSSGSNPLDTETYVAMVMQGKNNFEMLLLPHESQGIYFSMLFCLTFYCTFNQYYWLDMDHVVFIDITEHVIHTAVIVAVFICNLQPYELFLWYIMHPAWVVNFHQEMGIFMEMKLMVHDGYKLWSHRHLSEDKFCIDNNKWNWFIDSENKARYIWLNNKRLYAVLKCMRKKLISSFSSSFPYHDIMLDSQMWFGDTRKSKTSNFRKMEIRFISL